MAWFCIHPYVGFDISLLAKSVMPRDNLTHMSRFIVLLLTILLSSLSVAQNATDALDNSIENEGNTTLSLTPLPVDSDLNATGTEPQCSSYEGVNLDAQSCEDLISQIPDTVSALLDWNGEKVQAPARWSSCK